MSTRNVIFFILTIVLLILILYNFISLLPACIFFVLGVVDTARNIRQKTLRQKLWASVYLFVVTIIGWLAIDLFFHQKGPGVIIFIFYLGAQALTALAYLFRPFIWIPIVAGLVVSALM